MEYQGKLYGRLAGKTYFYLGVNSGDYDFLKKKISDLEKENELLLGALSDISEGKGRYNPDRLTHASNTIEDMVKLAKDAILESEKLNGLS